MTTTAQRNVLCLQMKEVAKQGFIWGGGGGGGVICRQATHPSPLTLTCNNFAEQSGTKASTATSANYDDCTCKVI